MKIYQWPLVDPWLPLADRGWPPGDPCETTWLTLGWPIPYPWLPSGLPLFEHCSKVFRTLFDTYLNTVRPFKNVSNIFKHYGWPLLDPWLTRWRTLADLLVTPGWPLFEHCFKVSRTLSDPYLTIAFLLYHRKWPARGNHWVNRGHWNIFIQPRFVSIQHLQIYPVFRLLKIGDWVLRSKILLHILINYY